MKDEIISGNTQYLLEKYCLEKFASILESLCLSPFAYPPDCVIDFCGRRKGLNFGLLQ